MLRVIWSTEAKIDLRAKILFRRDEYGEIAASKFFASVESTIQRAQSHPTAYQIQSKKLGIRRIKIDKNEVLYFQVKQNSLRIVRIRSDRQDPAGLGF